MARFDSSFAANVRAASRPLRALRILVADDDRDAAATLAMLLLDEGHLVREVYRGDAVPAFVRDYHPDVVLLDVGMPGMSGYDVVSEIKAQYGKTSPLVIAVTAWDQAGDKRLGRIVGFDHYVTKPYDSHDILALIAPLACASTH